MIHTRKYTDTDVRLHPELRRLAIAYAIEYDGQFDYMLRARAQALATGDLEPGVIRGVLNCMRTDPQAASRLAEHPATRIAVVTPIRRYADDDHDEEEHQDHRDRRVILRMRTTIKLLYGMARNGTVLHIPHTDTYVQWRNATMVPGGWRWHDQPVPEHLAVKWLCGATAENPILLPAYDPEEDRPCRTCFATRTEQTR